MGAAQSTSDPCTLQTPKGIYRGVEQSDSSGKPVLRRFTRVPYAQPPVGPLRFRRPQRLSGDAAQTSKNDDFGPVAPQPVYAMNKAMVDPPDVVDPPQDEDCLYLNIWVPLTGSPPAEGWPVQFHIHGGWLQVGQANQTAEYDPFDIFASPHLTNRIIVAPTYRLNIFGFAGGKDLNEVVQQEGDAFAGNLGLWDQRAALEWVSENIATFGGDPKLITVGGLSAGAHSAWLQLYHDSFLPLEKQIISQVYLWSNALAVQPNPTTSEPLSRQFDELCEEVGIQGASHMKAEQKVQELRQVHFKTLIDVIPKLKMHTFRSSTDGPIDKGGFLPPTYLQSLHDGSLASRLAKRGVRIMLGEVMDEGLLYKLINPPESREDLKVQLNNYYPTPVVDALIALPAYKVPESNTEVSKDQWATIFGTITGDCQVHASIRGLAQSLLHPPADSTALHTDQLFRYKISWRAKSLDKVLKPEVGVCHAGDTPIWWASGWRAGYSDDDKKKAEAFLEPFGRFLQGEKDIGWGGTGTANEIRLFTEDGQVKDAVKDQAWDHALEVWEAIRKAQAV